MTDEGTASVTDKQAAIWSEAEVGVSDNESIFSSEMEHENWTFKKGRLGDVYGKAGTLLRGQRGQSGKENSTYLQK